jgi:hypothetical protein
MFNATGGYLIDPYQAHWSVVCTHRHIQNSNRPLAKKSAYFPSTIQETTISIFLQALHYLIKEIRQQKNLRGETTKIGSLKMYAPWPQTATFQDHFFP